MFHRQSEYRERAELAEEQLISIKEQVVILNKEIEKIIAYKKEFDSKMQVKEQEIAAFKENVQSYVNLKVS